MQAALKAFDLAWAEMAARPDYRDSVAARELLANRVIGTALEHRERDPERLKSAALCRKRIAFPTCSL